MQSFLTAIQAQLYPGLQIALRIFLITAAILFAIYAIATFTFPFPLAYGEAPLIDQAARLAAGENIYPADLSEPPFTVSSYPPLYTLILTPFADLGAGSFMAGRVIALLSGIIAACLIVLITLYLTKNREASVAAGLVFLAIPFVFYWTNLVQVNSLALALSLGGVYILLRWFGRRWGFMVGGALLVAALFAHQAQAVAAPIAAFAWLWMQDRRQAVKLIGFVAGLSLLILLILVAITDGGFWFHTVTANLNGYSLSRLSDHLRDLGLTMPILLVLAGGFLLFGRKLGRGWMLLAVYLIGAMLITFVSGKTGTASNYFLELAAAVSLAIGGLLHLWQPHRWRYSLIALLLTLQIGWMMQQSMARWVDQHLTIRKLDYEALTELSNVIDQTDGPLLADEFIGLMTLRNKPLYLQPFEMSQLAQAGRWNQDLLLTELQAQTFPLIMITRPAQAGLNEASWTPEMEAAIEAHYIPTVSIASTIMYEPRQATAISPIPQPEADTAFFSASLEVGSLTQLDSDLNVYQPAIAISPTDPNHLAAIVTTTPDQLCDRGNCEQHLVLFTSQDGAETWQRQVPFGTRDSAQGQVAFGPNGRLYLMGLRQGAITINWATPADNYEMTLTNQEDVTRGQVRAKPWLQVSPQSDTLFLSYANQYRNRLFMAPTVIRSTDAGQNWSHTASVNQSVSIVDLVSRNAIWPDDIQLLFGKGDTLALVWTWTPDDLAWPRGVWLATSDDGGETFANGVQIGDTWGPITATAQQGVYYLLYRTGPAESPEIVLARSANEGESWQATIISGDIPLQFDVSKAPGLHVTEPGLVDIIFYAPLADSPICFVEVDMMVNRGGVDQCHYNLYYTYSRDGGQTFSQPQILNESPINGSQFVQWQGASQMGPHLAIAANQSQVYPMWVDTVEGGSRAVMLPLVR